MQQQWCLSLTKWYRSIHRSADHHVHAVPSHCGACRLSLCQRIPGIKIISQISGKIGFSILKWLFASCPDLPFYKQWRPLPPTYTFHIVMFGTLPNYLSSVWILFAIFGLLQLPWLDMQISTSSRVLRTSSLQMASEAVPHGGKLVNTMITDNQLKNDAMTACNFAVELDERQLCDVELLMQGALWLFGWCRWPSSVDIILLPKIAHYVVLNWWMYSVKMK